MRTCATCHHSFTPIRPAIDDPQNKRYQKYCNHECRRAGRFLRQSQPEYRAQRNHYSQEQRQKVLMFLGGHCVRCSNNDIRVLQIDHIDGGGTKEVKTIGLLKMFQKILSGSPGYQCLCANCNWVKRHENQEVGPVSIGPRYRRALRNPQKEKTALIKRAQAYRSEGYSCRAIAELVDRSHGWVHKHTNILARKNPADATHPKPYFSRIRREPELIPLNPS